MNVEVDDDNIENKASDETELNVDKDIVDKWAWDETAEVNEEEETASLELIVSEVHDIEGKASVEPLVSEVSTELVEEEAVDEEELSGSQFCFQQYCGKSNVGGQPPR